MDLYPLTEKNFRALVKRVGTLLAKGGVAAVPTDTVYGLAADVEAPEAVAKVARIKGRSPQKAMPVFVRDTAMARQYVQIEPELMPFLERIWPGQTTVVFLRKPRMLPDAVSGGMKTVGLRVPAHPFLRALLEDYPHPLTGTSANISGGEPAQSGEAVRRAFAGRVPRPDLIVDAGMLPPSPPSTVLDLTDPRKPQILRMGAVTKEKLEEFFSFLGPKP
ncbi:MAG: threonylcarbamoyl-AMP synthase [Candidatus Sungbacteria bacterium RIFCSPLOWO2_01_FULL_59_16]|uniref:L-threonylcarbamoyladenylate synthase n=1 Tax=Candidatus Sungbacteria bacterium RIFCSPLOWO2_01_FULL_59_16 TaxID=1802280 RepID=A0A1G2LC10_9BACT|nr:MAG: threonylcarbamoyl-AMP synthase [Candidatus Sungbacteria bacterium RIFCSPLOWO2_01_FULL_59_16]